MIGNMNTVDLLVDTDQRLYPVNFASLILLHFDQGRFD